MPWHAVQSSDEHADAVAVRKRDARSTRVNGRLRRREVGEAVIDLKCVIVCRAVVQSCYWKAQLENFTIVSRFGGIFYPFSTKTRLKF